MVVVWWLFRRVNTGVGGRLCVLMKDTFNHSKTLCVFMLLLVNCDRGIPSLFNDSS